MLSSETTLPHASPPPGIAAERRFATVLGVRTAYYRAGQGPSLVLLHGGAPGASSDVNWHRNFGFFVDHGFDVVAYDQPGHGHSDDPFDHTVEFRYRHAVALIELLGMERVFLVGNSIGGLLSILMQHRRASLPFAIAAMVVAAPAPHFPISDAAKRMSDEHRKRLTGVEPTFSSVQNLCRTTFFDTGKLSDELVQLRLENMRRNWTSLVARRQVGNGFDPRGVDDAMVTVRSLVVWGMKDRSVPVQVGFESVPRYADAQFVFLPDCGHWPQTEQAERFNGITLAFLQACVQSDGVTA